MSTSQELIKKVTRKVRRPLGVLRRWLRSLPFRTQMQKERLLKEGSSLDAGERGLLRQVESRVSRHDGMYKGNGEHYYKVGLSAIHCIDEALRAAGIESVKNVLDMPSGHGRVLRFLVHRFPEARFTACDLDRDAVDFCAQTFNVAAAYSKTNLDELSLAQKFDLIWCGSLITHLESSPMLALLRFFRRHLLPGGLVIFTTNGDYVSRIVLKKASFYGLEVRSMPSLTASYSAGGYGYLEYPDRSNYGVSLTSPEWIRRQVEQMGGLREVYFKERGWDNHQDVFGFVREVERGTGSSTQI